jgi:hypothetical protein
MGDIIAIAICHASTKDWNFNKQNRKKKGKVIDSNIHNNIHLNNKPINDNV